MTCKNLKQYSDQMYCRKCQRGCDKGDEGEPEFQERLRCNENPFYRNPIFTREDITRAKFNPASLWTRLNLMFLPTFCQINDGYAFFWKQRPDGRIYLMDVEPMAMLDVDRMIDHVPVSDDPDEKTMRTLY